MSRDLQPAETCVAVREPVAVGANAVAVRGPVARAARPPSPSIAIVIVDARDDDRATPPIPRRPAGEILGLGIAATVMLSSTAAYLFALVRVLTQ